MINFEKRPGSASSQGQLRVLQSTPGYFFLVWRWATWIYALAWCLQYPPKPTVPMTIPLFLTITFVETLAITLYSPFQLLLPNLPLPPWLKRQPTGILTHDQADLVEEQSEKVRLLTPLSGRRSIAKDLLIYGLDVLICGLATYYTAPYWTPMFGDASPFYRYGLASAFAAAFAYGYRGGLAAALAYDLFILIGAYSPPPGIAPFIPQPQDLLGSLIDAPIAATLAAYMATLLYRYIQIRRQIQADLQRQRVLLEIGETLLTEASNRQRLLQQSAGQIQRGGNFERVILAQILPISPELPEPKIEFSEEVGVIDIPSPDTSHTLLLHTATTRKKLAAFEMLYSERGRSENGIARLYLPVFVDEQIRLLVGAESVRQQPFDEKQESFLTLASSQLAVALENIRLTEQSTALAATAERGRIAREIHDGVAQLTYMLSLHSETCLALSKRLEEEQPDRRAEIQPLSSRLETLVTVSKQALWETRHYMFTLKPLISGDTTITQMLTTQVKEFEAISGLAIELRIEGKEQPVPENPLAAHKLAQIGTTLFRIAQEALSNAYKHANATKIFIRLYHHPHSISMDIEDDGLGLEAENAQDEERLYSGYGLKGMRERAEELGGSFELRSLPGSGLRIHVNLPVLNKK